MDNVTGEKGYIDDDVQGRPMLWLLIGFIIFTVLSFAGVYWLYAGLSGFHTRNQEEARTKVATGEVTPPGPQLQADPVADMNAMNAEQEALLSSYGWVDEEHGVARIPIEKAMELTLEKSLVRSQQNDQAPAAAEAANQE